MTPEEEAHLRQLGQALEAVSRWETDVTGSRAGAWQAVPGSELETDDKLAHPFTVSLAPWSAVTAAVSHLGALRDSLFQATGPAKVHAQIHTHGQLTLVRGALENASLAFWLLEDDQSVERIVRRIQEDWEEIRQLEVVRSEVGAPSEKTMADREREMTDLLVKVGGDPSRLKKRPGYGEIVKLAGASQPAGRRQYCVRGLEGMQLNCSRGGARAHRVPEEHDGGIVRTTWDATQSGHGEHCTHEHWLHDRDWRYPGSAEPLREALRDEDSCVRQALRRCRISSQNVTA